MLHPHFCRLMKDHKRLVATESIPILSTTSSKTQNSVVPLLLSMNYYFVWLDGVNKGYHTGTIRPLTHKYSSAKLLAFKICDFFAYDYCINLCISQFHAILIFFSSLFWGGIIQSQAAFVNCLYVARFTIARSKTQIKFPLLLFKCHRKVEITMATISWICCIILIPC